MRRFVQDSCAQSRPGRAKGRRLREDQPDCAHPDPDRSRRAGREIPDRDPVLGGEKTGKFLPADPIARVRVFHASVNQTIFFLGARMPEKVPDSAIKFYEDRFVNLWRFADDQLAKSQYLAGDEITAADLAVYPIYAGRKALPDNAGLTRLQAWGERIGSRPGVQKGMKLEN
jgi:hypothetical protein